MEVLLHLVVVLVLVVGGFGALAHVAGRRTSAIYWGGIHWFGNQFLRLGNWAWTHHPEFVIGVAVGAFIMFMVMSP